MVYCIIKCNTYNILKKHSKNDILISLTKLERIILTMLNNNITISKKYHYKHLTPSNRGQIQACRNEGKSIHYFKGTQKKHESVLCTSILLVRTWNKRKHKRTDKGVLSEKKEHEWKREGNIRNTKNFK